MASGAPKIVGYAAVGSVAALVAAYVLGPSLFPPDQDRRSARAVGGGGAVGLTNPANDCFINSILQALAGLPLLSKYLNEAEVSSLQIIKAQPDQVGPTTPEKTRDFNFGGLTSALDALEKSLNSGPAYRKAISAKPLIRTLEHTLNRHLSRRQQDAQEFLQVVLELLHLEHDQRRKASLAQEKPLDAPDAPPHTDLETERPESDDKSFPFVGRLDSFIQCTFCNYQPEPTSTSFVTLTLNVPLKSTCTLNECLDGLFKVETVADYRCARCSINEVIERKQKELSTCRQEQKTIKLGNEISLLREALLRDPTQPPPSVEMPEESLSPRRTISKHVRMSKYPAILALHLSRSIYDGHNSSRKNYATVSFPETLAMGGFERRDYRLQCVVAHRGGHDSGHYETFRRQHQRSRLPSEMTASAGLQVGLDVDLVSENSDASDLGPPITSASVAKSSRVRKRKHAKALPTKWWRISDDYSSECRTNDVLAMQKDAYLLFYELA